MTLNRFLLCKEVFPYQEGDQEGRQEVGHLNSTYFQYVKAQPDNKGPADSRYLRHQFGEQQAADGTGQEGDTALV